MANAPPPLQTYYITPAIPFADPNLGWDRERTIAHFRTHAPRVGDLVILQLGHRRYALTPINMVTQGKRPRIVTAAKLSNGANDWLFSGKNNWGSSSIRLLPATNETLVPILEGNKQGITIVWEQGSAIIVQALVPLSDESEAVALLHGQRSGLSVTENGKRLRTHLIRERKSAKLRREKIALLAGKAVVCEVCGFNFRSAYGLNEDFIEAHHRVPLSKTEKVRVTTLDGISLLCSNCHRAIHIISP